MRPSAVAAMGGTEPENPTKTRLRVIPTVASSCRLRLSKFASCLCCNQYIRSFRLLWSTVEPARTDDDAVRKAKHSSDEASRSVVVIHTSRNSPGSSIFLACWINFRKSIELRPSSAAGVAVATRTACNPKRCLIHRGDCCGSGAAPRRRRRGRAFCRIKEERSNSAMTTATG